MSDIPVHVEIVCGEDTALVVTPVSDAEKADMAKREAAHNAQKKADADTQAKLLATARASQDPAMQALLKYLGLAG